MGAWPLVGLLMLAGWWVWDLRRVSRKPKRPPVRVPPRPAQVRRRTDAAVADEAERIIRGEIARAIEDGSMAAR